MRTTIDMPDELLRQVKARAALDGMKLKDLITRYVANGLRESSAQVRPGRPARSALPLIPSAMTGAPIPALSNRELAEIELEEDLARYDRSTGR